MVGTGDTASATCKVPDEGWNAHDFSLLREAFGADPYLQGQLVAQMVEGMQESVVATVKHFIGKPSRSLLARLRFSRSNVPQLTLLAR